jgi:tripartite-type tricarboxylate transporter receptor subunit TctC
LSRTAPALSAKLPFDPVRSFAPVVQIAASELTLVVHPQLPVRSVREFVELAKRQPGKLHYSSPGNGGPQHLAMELLKLETGIELVHVPYKGASGAMQDLVGGHVQATISSVQTAYPLVQAGKLRALALMSAERSSAYPDVPTMKEQGLPGLEVETWYGLFAPAGISRDILSKLNADIDLVLKDAAVRATLEKQGMSPAGGPPQRLEALVQRELPRWARVVRAAGIRAD